MTKTLLATIVAGLALVVAGCGGSDGETTTSAEATATTEWADGLCAAISTWKDELTSVTDQFTDLSSFSEEGLQNAADDVKSATDTFLEDVTSLGTPDTESGEEVKASVDELSTTLQNELDSIQTTVEDTSGITALPGAVADITASITAMSTALSSTITTIEDADVQGEIKDAIDNSPDCASISS